jgi:hypothetical protein
LLLLIPSLGIFSFEWFTRTAPSGSAGMAETLGMAMSIYVVSNLLGRRR